MARCPFPGPRHRHAVQHLGQTCFATSLVGLAVACLVLALTGTNHPRPSRSARGRVRQVLAIAGSDTTEDVMDDFTAARNANGTANPDPDLAFALAGVENARLGRAWPTDNPTTGCIELRDI